MSVAVEVSYSPVDVESPSPTDQPQRTRQDLLTKGRSASERSPFSEKAKPGSFDHSALSEIIRRAQLSDSAAFEVIYQQNAPRVYALCLRMLRDPVEAEDLTQEAFLQLFRKLKTFRGESAFSAWLHRLTVNLVLMRLRKKSPPTASIEATGDQDDETAPPTIDVGVLDLRLEGSIDRLRLEPKKATVEQLASFGHNLVTVGTKEQQRARMVTKSAVKSLSTLQFIRRSG